MPTMVMTRIALRSNAQRRLADVGREERQRAVDPAHRRRARAAPGRSRSLPVLEPDLEQQDAHEVPRVHEAEHRHRRGQVRGEEDLVEPLRVAEVQQQRQRRHQQERERREQGQPVGRLHLLDVEDLHERRQDERPRHEPGDVRVDDDQDRPVDLDLVGIDVPGDLLEQLGQARRGFGVHRTSPSSCA